MILLKKLKLMASSYMYIDIWLFLIRINIKQHGLFNKVIQWEVSNSLSLFILIMVVLTYCIPQIKWLNSM